MTWEILTGDCRDLLAQLPAGSVHTVVTSPPYFGLRDYNAAGQIGLEPTPDEFVTALVEVFRGVRRVLRDDGTVWLNLGDSYAGSPANGWREGAARADGDLREDGQSRRNRNGTGSVPGVKAKDLIGIPWLVAFALRADGWYLRSDIVWHKPNPMPESVTDRPTRSHEFIFLLTKNSRYFYDSDSIRESATSADDPRGPERMATGWDDGRRGHAPEVGQSGHLGIPVAGRNRRDVWTVSTKPYAGAHFATFPPDLIEPCVLAGCPERACGACGAPWERIVERTAMVVRPSVNREAAHDAGSGNGRRDTRGTMTEAPTSRTLGFEPSCECNADPAPGRVLDPFAGAGTTGIVAIRNRRSFVGLELNPEYAQMARDRIDTDIRLGHRSPQRVDVDPEQLGMFG